MTNHDLYDDAEVRDAIHALAPDVDMVFDRIERRATGMRRRVHRRIAVTSVVIALVGAGAAFALRGSQARGSVDVDQPGRSPHHGHVVTTSPATATPNGGANRHETGNGSPGNTKSASGGAIGGSYNNDVVIPGDSPTTLPHRDDSTSPTTAPAFTTTPTTEPAEQSTTTTTVAQSDVPPVGPGHTRMTVILDDTGLHAPSFVATGDAVEVLFLDQRSVRPAKTAYLFSKVVQGYPSSTIFVARWDSGPYAHVSSVPMHNPATIELSVQDSSCSCTLSAHATVTIGASS